MLKNFSLKALCLSLLYVGLSSGMAIVDLPFDTNQLQYYVNYRKVVTDTYADIDDARITPEDKARIEALGPSSSVYGEIQFEGLVVLVYYLMYGLPEGSRLNTQSVFVDGGSGVGKVVFTTFLLSPCMKAFGIEYAKARNDIALQILKVAKKIYAATSKFENAVRKHLGEDPLPTPKTKEINYVNNSFLEEDLSDVTHFYTCSTLFSDQLLKDLAAKFNAECKDGMVFITLKLRSKHMDEYFAKQNLHLIKTFYLPMTWTPNDHVYVYILDRKKKYKSEPDYEPYRRLDEDEPLFPGRVKTTDFSVGTQEEESEEAGQSEETQGSEESSQGQ